ncbi:polysaccharide biosynthesis tyrosine autokinase [Cypionkella sp.]|uniref:polysaccharide biosynthesis tyrosine autokinase n=1 Tax=Cypionkella sp. TaxID=2811411 RepID=UPI00271A86FF|nr:polysaccharide biosynthesis tyrosine autokinase [Cypionkella sp.]MDO8982394.1 polysaccharide biosynthesis tyrosine autokinase [Cypionkella sp.]MDP2050645.1 polysaccharide biosynthesis tyrosine autokinase [Cypionkella sp.]
MTPNPVSMTSPERDDDEIDLGALLAQFWAGKWHIGAFVLVAGIIGLANAMLTPPTYQADALLQLEAKKASLALPAAMSDLMNNDPVTVTEIEIIRSRMVVGRAVAELHLDWQVTPRTAPVIGSALARYALPIPEVDFLTPYIRRGDSIRLDYLEVPPEWVGQAIVLTSGADNAYRLDLPNGTSVEGRTGETLQDPILGYSVRIGELTAPPGRQFSLVHQSESAAIDGLRNALSVSERGRQSAVLELRLTSGDRQQAQRVLDAIAQAYLAQNIARSAAEAEGSLTFVEKQLPDAERAVAEAESALNSYRQKQQSVDLSLETQGLLSQTTSLEAELRGMDAQEEELRQKYTKSHPIYQELLANRARLEEQLAKLRSEVEALPETQRKIVNLTRTLELAQAVYVQLLNRSQELRVLRASSIGNVRIIDSARTAQNAIAPRKALILALSLVLGGMAGVGYILVRNWLHQGVRGADQLEKLGLPVFATINYSPVGFQARNVRDSLSILAIREPTDLAVEGFRSLRTSLHFGMLDAKTRSVAIISSAPEAGKSFTCINLSVLAAQAGQRVCLVDADMRRGMLRRYFNLPKNTPGLAELLAGKVTLDEVLVEGPVPGLSFLPTGRFPPNPSELLMRASFSELIETLNTRFDLTLLDSSPVLAVTDPVVIGRATGATIAVVRHDVTPIGEVLAMQRALAIGGVRLAGVVLNGFDPRKARAYSYNYSYRYEYKKKAE